MKNSHFNRTLQLTKKVTLNALKTLLSCFKTICPSHSLASGQMFHSNAWSLRILPNKSSYFFIDESYPEPVLFRPHPVVSMGCALSSGRQRGLS